MANFDQLKQSVANVIKTNGAEEITGAIMQDVLLTIINSIAGGYMFGGVAQHSGNVGNPDYNVFYLAGSGSYTGYGGAITIEAGCYGVFRYNGTWHQEVVDIGVRLSGSIAAGETRGVTGDVINTALQQLFNNVMDILDTLTFTYNTPSAQQATKAMLDVIMTPTGGSSHVFGTLTLASATVAAAGLMSAEDKQKVDRMITDFRSLSLTDTTAAADQATKIVQTLSATLGENPEAITTMTFLAATASKAGLMSAADKAVLDCLVAMLGYYECPTAAGTAAKVVSASGYSLTSGGCIRIKMTNANTANNVTLNINSTGAKALYYDGAQASATNTWEAGEVLEVYYDGTQYQCASGGGGQFASGEKIKDVSITQTVVDSNNAIPSSKVFYEMMKDTAVEHSSYTISRANNTLKTITLVGGRTYTFILTSSSSATIATWNFYLRDVTAAVDIYNDNKSNITANSGRTYTYTCPASRDGHTCNIGLFTTYRSGVTLDMEYEVVMDFFNKGEIDELPKQNSQKLVTSGGIYSSLQTFIPKTEMTAWFESSVSNSISNRQNVTFFRFTPDKIGQKYIFVFSSGAAVGGTKFNIWINATGSGDVLNKNMSSLPANTDLVVEYIAVSTAAHALGVYMEGTAGTVNLDISIENVNREIALLSDLSDDSKTYNNPVIHNDSADPTVYQDNYGNYYLLSTKNTNSSVNAAPYTSRDCIHWEAHNDALFDAESLSTLTEFATALWAPQVIKIGDLYTMYLAVHKSNHNSRIAVLQSKLPTGLFKFKTWLIDSSLVNDTDQIDACPVYDRDGNLWLAFGGGVLYIVKMSDDGLSIDSSTLKHIAGVRGLSYGASGYQEGAYLYYRNGYYYLFGAGGDYVNSTYNIQVARSENVDGTYLNKDGVDVTTAASTIIMQSSGTLYGSGHNGEIIKDRNNKTHMFYHAHWTGGSSMGARFTCIQELLWDENGWPYFEDGSAKLSCKTFMV